MTHHHRPDRSTLTKSMCPAPVQHMTKLYIVRVGHMDPVTLNLPSNATFVDVIVQLLQDGYGHDTLQLQPLGPLPPLPPLQPSLPLPTVGNAHHSWTSPHHTTPASNTSSTPCVPGWHIALTTPIASLMGFASPTAHVTPTTQTIPATDPITYVWYLQRPEPRTDQMALRFVWWMHQHGIPPQTLDRTSATCFLNQEEIQVSDATEVYQGIDASQVNTMNHLLFFRCRPDAVFQVCNRYAFLRYIVTQYDQGQDVCCPLCRTTFSTKEMLSIVRSPREWPVYFPHPTAQHT